MTYVSPNITREQWDSGKKTDMDVFENQLDGWLFKQAKALVKRKQAGPAILALVTPYFEVIESYIRGKPSKDQSSKFLKAGLREVFPNVDSKAISKYAVEIRHGFAHEAMFRRVALHHGDATVPTFGVVNGILHVDPWWILETADRHFKAYVATLRAGNDPALLKSWRRFMNYRKQR